MISAMGFSFGSLIFTANNKHTPNYHQALVGLREEEDYKQNIFCFL